MVRGHGEGPSKSRRCHGDPQQPAATGIPQRPIDHNDGITVASNAHCDQITEIGYAERPKIAPESPLSVNPTRG